jgi:N-methylhydantoinase A/oxoprolinase/acetone carboxylase beta subunit
MVDKINQTKVAIDIGGTFTDLIYFSINSSNSDVKIGHCKVDTSVNFEEGMIKAID